MSKAQTATAAKKPRTPSKGQLAKAAALGLDENAKITNEQREGERRAADANKASQNSMAFAVQQLGTPPVAKTPPAALEQFNKELEELKAKHNIPTAAVKVATPKAEKIQQNGVTRPGEGTLCGKIWAAADELSKQSQGVATIAALKLHADVQGVNDHTIKTQYARWRSFNGIAGRLPKILAAQQERPIFNAEGHFGDLEKF